MAMQAVKFGNGNSSVGDSRADAWTLTTALEKYTIKDENLSVKGIKYHGDDGTQYLVSQGTEHSGRTFMFSIW